MDKFTASNGGIVRRIDTDDGSRLTVHVNRAYNFRLPGGENTAYLIDDQRDALREFFQAERDEELGRWRWPENPEWVAVEGDRTFDGRTVVVVNERTLDRFCGNERVRDCAPDADAAHQAARAYFEAHPEPKPWEDAKHEEVWLLTVNGDTGPFLAHEDALMGLVFTASNGTRVQSNDDEQITAGRRIFPEVF